MLPSANVCALCRLLFLRVHASCRLLIRYCVMQRAERTCVMSGDNVTESFTLGLLKTKSGTARAMRPVRANVGVVPMAAL